MLNRKRSVSWKDRSGRKLRIPIDAFTKQIEKQIQRKIEFQDGKFRWDAASGAPVSMGCESMREQCSTPISFSKNQITYKAIIGSLICLLVVVASSRKDSRPRRLHNGDIVVEHYVNFMSLKKLVYDHEPLDRKKHTEDQILSGNIKVSDDYKRIIEVRNGSLQLDDAEFDTAASD